MSEYTLRKGHKLQLSSGPGRAYVRLLEVNVVDQERPESDRNTARLRLQGNATRTLTCNPGDEGVGLAIPIGGFSVQVIVHLMGVSCWDGNTVDLDIVIPPGECVVVGDVLDNQD